MYILKRIFRLNTKKLFDTVNYVHNKNQKSKFFIFFDIVWCGLRYQAGYVDYRIFELFNLNAKERNNIVTRGFNNKVVKRFNDPEKNYIFNNKVTFNELFDKYLGRDWLSLNDYEEFLKFIKKHPRFIAKPLNLSCGKGIEIIDNIHDPKETFDKLMENKQFLLEELIVQDKSISDIYPLSTNSIRVVTMNHKVVMAFFRIGNDGNTVDNFNHGGMVAPVDLETGEVYAPAIDKSGNVFEIHPYTKTKIINFVIPRWNDIKNFCENLCNIVPELGYVGWDISVGEKLYLIEGNEYPGYDLYELPVHRKGKVGHKDMFLKYWN